MARSKVRDPSAPVWGPSNAEFGAYTRDLLASVQKVATERSLTMLARLLESAALEAARIADGLSDDAED
jgi:hypothetical protein